MRLRLVRVMAILTILSMMAAPVTAQPLASSGATPLLRPIADSGAPPDLQAETNVTVVAAANGGLTARQIQDKYGALGDQEVVILVQLADPDVVSYRGGINGMAATAATESQPFNAQSPTAQAYMAYLTNRQTEFVLEAAEVDASVNLLYHYVAALNGVALSVPAWAVEKISRLPGVQAVFENTIAHPDTG